MLFYFFPYYIPRNFGNIITKIYGEYKICRHIYTKVKLLNFLLLRYKAAYFIPFKVKTRS